MYPGTSSVPETGGVIQTLTDLLRRDISLGLIPAGSKLKILQIQKEYGVSAASAREALSQLSGEGYATTIEQRGFFVAEMSQAELLDNARVRSELEALGLAWSIANQTPEWRASIVSAHYLLKEAEGALELSLRDNIISWDDRNRDFHLALISNAKSPVLQELVLSSYNLTRRYRLQAYAVELGRDAALARLKKSAQEHENIAAAALSMDAARGGALLKAHIHKPTQ